MSIDKKEVMGEAFKSAPPVTIVAAHTIFGLELNEWLTVFSIIYVLLQTYFLLNKHFGKKDIPIKLEPDE